MKTKLFILCTLCVALFMFCACEEPISPNKYADKTNLWPAADPTGEKVGYINEKGEMVIPAQYKKAYFFSGGMAKVVTFENQIQFINTKGEVVHTLPENLYCDDYFINGYIRYYQYVWDRVPPSGLWDMHFNDVIPFGFLRVGNMSKEGLVATGVGYFNKNGERVLTFNADTIDLYNGTFYNYGDFCDGAAVIHLQCIKNGFSYGRAGAINTRGEWVVDTMYYDLKSVGGGLIAYPDTTGLWGLMDTQGSIVTEPKFNEVGDFEDGDLLPVRNNNGWGYVDHTGTIKIEPIYAYCEPFHEGVAWVSPEQNYYSLIDTSGKVLINLERGVWPVTDCHNGLMAIADYINYENKYIDKNNHVIYTWDAKEGRGFYPSLLPKSNHTNNNRQ